MAGLGIEPGTHYHKGGKAVDISAADEDYALSANIGSYPRSFMVTVAGNVKLDIAGAPSGWGTITIPVITGREYSFVGITKIWRTGTTATGIIIFL